MARYTLNQVIKAIDRAKAKLIKKAQQNGLYENFGQDEVYAIRQKFAQAGWWGDHYVNHDTYLQAIQAVNNFDNWASTYSPL